MIIGSSLSLSPLLGHVCVWAVCWLLPLLLLVLLFVCCVYLLWVSVNDVCILCVCVCVCVCAVCVLYMCCIYTHRVSCCVLFGEYVYVLCAYYVPYVCVCVCVCVCVAVCVPVIRIRLRICARMLCFVLRVYIIRSFTISRT